MKKLVLLPGERFGKLVVVKEAAGDGQFSRWWVKCDCGASTTMRGSNLKSGNAKSCGCELRKARDEYHKKRRKSETDWASKGNWFGRKSK